MNRLTFHPISECFPLMKPVQIAELGDDIKTNGQLTPIVLYDGQILDGRNRYHAVISSSIQPTFTTYTGNTPATYVSSLNQKRRHETEDQKALSAAKLSVELTKESKKGFSSHFVNELPKRDDSSPLGRNEKNRSVYKAAKGRNVSVNKTKQAVTLLKNEPEKAERIFNGELTFKELNKEKKVSARKQTIEQIKRKITAENHIMHEGKFDVVTIDPPWDYSERGGGNCDTHDPESNRGVVPYPTMTLETISKTKLPIKDDAVVFLWTTHAFLNDAFELLNKWGLTYKATIVWDKDKMGIGRTIRLQCEFCLLAVKGSPLLQGSAERDIIREKRREHSRKPEAFYKMVERMTVGKKLDYFAREQRKGWVAYGVEADKF